MNTFRLLWMVLGEDWGILFLFSFPLPSSKIIKGHNWSWLECVWCWPWPKKVLLQWGAGFTLHGRFASMVDYFAWCACIICASFSSSSPSQPPPKKKRTKLKKKSSLCYGLCVCRSISIWHSIDICLCMGWTPVCMISSQKHHNLATFMAFVSIGGTLSLEPILFEMSL